jgi:ankyrin repeat protein
VVALITKRAEANARDTNGETSLAISDLAGRHEIAELLIKNGAIE